MLQVVRKACRGSVFCNIHFLIEVCILYIYIQLYIHSYLYIYNYYTEFVAILAPKKGVW